MKNFDRSNRNRSDRRGSDRRDSRDSDRGDSDRRSFGRSDRRGAHGSNRRDSGRGFGRSREPLTMHKAICDECKQNCEVPFKPTSSKPIYCSDCFKKKAGSGRSGQNEEAFVQINEKLDKILEALEVK